MKTTIEGIIKEVTRNYYLRFIIYDGKKRTPIETNTEVKTDLELIPYQVALNNQQATLDKVEREQESSHKIRTKHTELTLKLLSGPLRNREYKWYSQ